MLRWKVYGGRPFESAVDARRRLGAPHSILLGYAQAVPSHDTVAVDMWDYVVSKRRTPGRAFSAAESTDAGSDQVQRKSYGRWNRARDVSR
jgi:D-serine deaminase-like pyridoxal phosphate-dependent protein